MRDEYETLAGDPEIYHGENFDDEDERHDDISRDDPWRGTRPFASLIGKGAILKPIVERESELDKRIQVNNY